MDDGLRGHGYVYALLADGTGGALNHSGYLMTFEENSDGTLTAATGLATLPGPSDPKATLVHWNNTLVNLSGTIYIYGSDDSSRTYVAKIAASALPYGFLGSWNLSFFSSGSWVPDQSKATPISPNFPQPRAVKSGVGIGIRAEKLVEHCECCSQ